MNPAEGGLGVTSGEPGHHSSEGRNVIPIGSDADGRGIFYAAVQMSRMPMCLTDPNQPDDPIVFCNHAFERLTGYAQSEMLGRNCRFLQGKNTDRTVIAEISRALAAGEDVHEEILNYRKDGTSFWNALFISPVNDTDGRLVYRFASQLDVTRRREAEMVLQQSQRMETLGNLASSLAHEFNNLMTIVLGSLERAEIERDDARRATQLKRATWGARRASRLTDQMLSFARRQFHDTRTLDLNAMLRNFDGILEQMAGLQAKVALDLAGGVLPVALDPGQLELALLNLVRNAADAGPPGGMIRIATQRLPVVAGSVPMAEIAIIDQGTGMSAETALRATEPFFTTKQPGHGTGLGLSMVSGFAEQSGGRLVIESTLGSGTTIRLLFPCRAEAEVEQPAS